MGTEQKKSVNYLILFFPPDLILILTGFRDFSGVCRYYAKKINRDQSLI